MKELVYRPLQQSDCVPGLLEGFERYQQVNKVWRTVNGEQKIVKEPFVDEWSREEREELVRAVLLPALRGGGAVFAAYDGDTLAGFAVLQPEPFGSEGQYRILAELHAALSYRRHGIGRRLFALCAQRARELGGKKLYISAHSAVESMAFYTAVGCVPAKELNRELVEKEPFDCQLEYVL